MRIADPEMLWVVNNLKSDLIEKVCQTQPLTQVSEVIEVLISLGDIEAQVEFISQNWDAITTASSLYRHLKACHNDPTAIGMRRGSSKSQRVWLYHDLIEWIKLTGKTRTSYGLARLLADIEEAVNDQLHQAEVLGIVKTVIEWRSSETIRLGLQDWHSSASKQSFPLYDDDLARVSVVLAHRLKKCGRPNPVKDTDAIISAIVQTNLEAKLLTYRHLQPIEAALTTALEVAGLPIRKLVYTKACFAQLAEADGGRLDPRSAGTSVVGVKRTIINWQSAHGSHTGDKTKELCGRAVALRYSWNSEAQTFTARHGVKKLILIVDGTLAAGRIRCISASGMG